jgi:hypothetical protein
LTTVTCTSQCSPLDAPPVQTQLPTKSGAAAPTSTLVCELNAPL